MHGLHVQWPDEKGRCETRKKKALGKIKSKESMVEKEETDSNKENWIL